MHVVSVVFVLATLALCLCVNEIEFEGNYADSYDNQIPQDHQEGEPLNPACRADLSRWDKLFISLEDSHMRQNMLLESVQQCCGGMASLKNQVDKLLKGTFQQYMPNLVSSCRLQAEQAGLKLHDSLVELRRDEAERERRINATLERMLHSRHEEDARLKRLEQSLSAENQPTPRPGALGASGNKPLLSGLKEMTSPAEVDAVKGSLVAIVTELQRVHLQLSNMMEQAGTLRNGRGDT